MLVIEERIHGNFDDTPSAQFSEAHLEMSIKSCDLKTRWQRCGFLSDVVARYVSAAYPEEGLDYKSTAFNSISTIFQELIENAAKYSPHDDAMIRIRVRHH